MARHTVEKKNATLNAAMVAWLVTSVFYFYQYVMRSAPSVMVPELSKGFGVGPAGVARLVGLFYYGYAIFSLVAGVLLDQLGPRRVVPIGAATAAVGALLFATGELNFAGMGCLMQGAGGVFALTGAVYIVTTSFPAARSATLVGLTQMLGMAGGFAGQFLVGPLIARGVPWDEFWFMMGFVGLVIARVLHVAIPGRKRVPKNLTKPMRHWLRQAAAATSAVFSNPQSLLCGFIAGLMFLPTSIFVMVWGVRFLQEGHDLPYAEAVMQSSSVLFGWIIGCPLTGALSDWIGRRKPVIIGAAIVLLSCLALILYGTPETFPSYTLGLATGIASSAAMIPYSVIKEANRTEHSGTATGVINFINFSFTAVLGPVFGVVLTKVSAGGPHKLEHYQTAFAPLVFGIAIAIVLALFLRETGPAARAISAHVPGGETQSRGKDRPLAAS